MNLAIVATVPVIEKHGLDNILAPFVTDLNTLATTGITLNANGINCTYKGTLLAFLADNLASNDMGGFKKSFSFSYRCCHTCMVTRDILSSHFASDFYEKRNEVSHLTHLQELDGDIDGHYSKTNGVNRW